MHFSSRDQAGRSQIGSFDFKPAEPASLSVRPEPEITLGELGSFDDNGVTTSCVVSHKGRRYHYYTGWNLGVTVPFYLGIGLAISEDGGETYRKVSGAPIMGRSAADPFLTASPFVLIEGEIWRMWYVSCSRWLIEEGRPKHWYHIRYAESHNGIDWKASGAVCIDFKDPSEFAISRPCVVKDGEIYKMWYAARGEKYRIGYAESTDGIRWTRLDHEAGIDVSAHGWDSEMIEYPHVFDAADLRYMLYNGNTFGKTGIGLAVLES